MFKTIMKAAALTTLGEARRDRDGKPYAHDEVDNTALETLLTQATEVQFIGCTMMDEFHDKVGDSIGISKKGKDGLTRFDYHFYGDSGISGEVELVVMESNSNATGDACSQINLNTDQEVFSTSFSMNWAEDYSGRSDFNLSGNADDHYAYLAQGIERTPINGACCQFRNIDRNEYETEEMNPDIL